MNSLPLNTKVILGVRILMAFMLLIVLHNVSSILNNLGIITDLFIVIGVYQSVKFLTNKELRLNSLTKLKNVVDLDSIDNFILNAINMATVFIKSKSDIGSDFDLKDMLDLQSPAPSFKVTETLDNSTQFTEITEQK